MNELTDTFPPRWKKAAPKPPKGTARVATRKRQAGVRTNEKSQKEKVRKLDQNRSRWPGDVANERLEVAHYQGKGMGGDHGVRSTAANLITFTWLTHQGPKSIHSGHKKVIPLTRKMMRGPVSFWERDTLGSGFGKWRCVGVESAVHVFERRP